MKHVWRLGGTGLVEAKTAIGTKEGVMVGRSKKSREKSMVGRGLNEQKRHCIAAFLDKFFT